MNFTINAAPKQIEISAVVMRKQEPEPNDGRPWTETVCPHCFKRYWFWDRGIVSFWHRNPLKRAFHALKRIGKGE